MDKMITDEMTIDLDVFSLNFVRERKKKRKTYEHVILLIRLN